MTWLLYLYVRSQSEQPSSRIMDGVFRQVWPLHGPVSFERTCVLEYVRICQYSPIPAPQPSSSFPDPTNLVIRMLEFMGRQVGGFPQGNPDFDARLCRIEKFFIDKILLGKRDIFTQKEIKSVMEEVL